jgi:hypothetical protein
MVTIYTAQWSLIYRTAVKTYTALLKKFVLHSGHYIYRMESTLSTVEWSLYVPLSGTI